MIKFTTLCPKGSDGFKIRVTDDRQLSGRTRKHRARVHRYRVQHFIRPDSIDMVYIRVGKKSGRLSLRLVLAEGTSRG